jgi:RNA polymerase sigma-70 factor, ECF subfamily
MPVSTQDVDCNLLTKNHYAMERFRVQPINRPDKIAMDALSDAEVYALLKQGNADALGTLYNRHGTVVYRLALRILTNAQEAEDLTQEAFLTLWHKGNYDPKRGSLSSFLLTLARSRSIDRLRSKASKLRSLQKFQHEFGHESGPPPLEKIDQRERSVLVRSALQQLPESQRRALELAYYEGLSQSEIAEKLDAPLGTVKTRCRQGLIKLRDLLRDLVG